MKLLSSASALVLAVTFCISAQAQIYLLSATAQVQRLDGEPGYPSIGLGSFLSVQLRYDLSIPGVKSDIFPDRIVTSYTPIWSEVTVGAVTFAMNDDTQQTPARLYATNGYFTSGYAKAGEMRADLFLLSSHLDLFSNQRPDANLSLDIFDYQAEIFTSGLGWEASGRLTSFSITRVEGASPVPEPSTYGLFACVVLMSLTLGRRKKSSLKILKSE